MKASTLGSLFLLIIVLAGCVLPYTESGTRAIARTGQDGMTNEVLFVVGHYYGWGAPLTPEGPAYITSTYKVHYYFSDRHVRRRKLTFLSKPNYRAWDVFAPVEGTNYWVRVEGAKATASARATNLIISVFTPQGPVYEETIPTRDSADEKFLGFAEGNRVLAYKSQSDDFAYDVLKRSFKPQRN